MTPSQDATPFKSPQYAESESSIVLPKQRQSPSSSLASLPYRRSNPSLTSLFASTSSLPSIRPSSGTATPPATVVPSSVFSPGARANGTSSPHTPPQAAFEETRSLILRSFVPHVGVLASVDTEELMRQKGFQDGFLELLRPFGESVPGKVTIRDSVGASKSWEDFGVRFTGKKDGLGLPSHPSRKSLERTDPANSTKAQTSVWSRTGGDIGHIEEVVDRHLSYAELRTGVMISDYFNQKADMSESATSASPFYMLYLRRLLSGLPMTPHETFSHPVACVIAISSKAQSPIEELRRLYQSTNTGDHRLPQWVNNDYLRYYVLVHDEDHDDIAKSTSLFEQMKRHFGLHCHLLRLRGDRCVSSDDDSIKLPLPGWMSASEELAEIQKRETADDLEDPTPYLFESDLTALKTFVRELVTQSVVPCMERLSATWNEQILSRRRGLSGRFMSLSKRWTPFGSSSRNASPTQGGSGSNYDSLQGFYRPDAPEAIMRKLADYAFMLRDFKLAQSTYELLRTDFNNDKAWKYYAGANEMAAIATLINPQPLSSKTRTEAIDQMLETASYSYITRCAAPYNALRTLSLGLELLKLRGSSAADDAARWGSRILENRLVGEIGHALFTERISACYQSRKGVGSMSWGSRRRKAALWAVLAADAWLGLDKSLQAEKDLNEASRLYGTSGQENPEKLAFDGMQRFMDELRDAVTVSRLQAQGYAGNESEAEEEAEPVVEEVSETLDKRSHRKSLIGVASGAPFNSLDPLGAGSLAPMRGVEEEAPVLKDDKFE